MKHRRGTDQAAESTASTTAPADGDGSQPYEFPEFKEVRASDIEPYTGLGYLSKLFRLMAVILLLLLVAEAATGFYTQGAAALPTLLGEASRLIVLAGVLWGTGDLAHLLIDVGHDVRAARILLTRAALLAKSDGRDRVLTERPRDAATPMVERGFADRPPGRR